MLKIVGKPCAVGAPPEHSRGAHSAPPDPLADGEGACCTLPIQGFLRVSLQLHKWGRSRRRRREDRGAEDAEGVGCGEGVFPSQPGKEAGEGLCPLPRNFFFDFRSENCEFWCILDSIFNSSATCFTCKTGVIWCPSPYFFFNFSLQKGPGSFSCILA